MTLIELGCDEIDGDVMTDNVAVSLVTVPA
jgi:hypothetical protein